MQVLHEIDSLLVEIVCDRNCSNHGVCVHPNVCNCDTGYFGDFCQTGWFDCLFVSAVLSLPI